MLHVQHCNAMGKMFHGQTLKSATSDYDQRHVIAFRPISAAARSWSYNNTNYHSVVCLGAKHKSVGNGKFWGVKVDDY